MRFNYPLELFQNLLKLHASKRGRLLGLHFGAKSIGLAVSDFDIKVAGPYCVMERKENNIDQMALEFEDLITKLSVSGFIVSYPNDRLEKNNPDATEVINFVSDLNKTKKLKGVAYACHEDCLATQHAKIDLMHPFNFEPHVADRLRVKFAAASMLQVYLDAVNRYALTNHSE